MSQVTQVVFGEEASGPGGPPSHLPSNSSDNSTTSDNSTGGLTPQQQFLLKAFGEPTFQAALKVQRYGAPIVIILGLVGNILSFLVMMQKHNRSKSTCIYLAALALTDIGSLITLAYLWFVTELQGPWSDAGCKIWVYVVFLMTAGSAFTLLVVTFDRWIAICFPFKAPLWCTIARTRIILIVTYAFVVVFYIPMALQSAVVDGPVCAAFAERTQAAQVLSWVNLAALPIIPFFLILAMNIMIIHRVYKSRAFQTKAAPPVNPRPQNGAGTKTNPSEAEAAPNTPEATSSTDRSRENQLTIMLLLVSFTYLVIILPISVRVLFYAFYEYTASTERYGVYVLLYSSLNLLLFLNNAINFYLYCLSGTRFRSDLRRLVGCKSKSSEASQASNTTSSSMNGHADTRI